VLSIGFFETELQAEPYLSTIFANRAMAQQ